MMTDSVLLNFAAQIPITALFVWFVVYLRNKEAEEREKRDSAFNAETTRRDIEWGNRINNIEQSRRADSELLTRGLDKISENVAASSKAIARLGALLVHHDATSRGQSPDVLGTTQEMVERILGNS